MMRKISIAQNPGKCIVECFNLPRKVLLAFRCMLFPQQIIWKRAINVEGDFPSITFIFPPFQVRRACTFERLGIINHRGELFAVNAFSSLIGMTVGDSFDGTYNVSIGIAPLQPLPELRGGLFERNY